MPPNPTDKKPPRRWRLRIFVTLLGLAVAVGLAAYMHNLETGLISAARTQALIDAGRPARPIAEVTQAVKAMKLVTVEIDTKVKVQRGDVSWRGDVSAEIEAPVRLSFGTDLSKIDVDAVTFSTLLGRNGSYVVRIPRPTRIATEVFDEGAAPRVKAGWLRMRSRAGEYYLSQARKDLPETARDLILLPEDAANVERVTKEQVTALMKAIVGKETDVEVVFSED